MRVFRNIIFLTLVLISCISFTAPSTDLEISPPKDSAIEYESDLKTEKKLYLGPHEWSISGGSLTGGLVENTTNITLAFLGLRYSYRDTYLTQYDFQIFWGHGQLLPLSWGYRWSCCAKFGSDFYYKAAAYTTLQSSDALANLTELRRLKLILAFGKDSLFNNYRNINMEIGIGYGLVGFLGYINFGYSWYF